MKEVLMAKETAVSEEGKEYNLDYILLVEELRAGDRMVCEYYGIKIVQECGGEVSEESVLGITMSGYEIDKLMELLREHKVMPNNLHDIIEDWVLEMSLT